jgi:hypothetical protein
VTRLVTITPSRNWGGSGALGCVLGFGALHHLPPPLNEPPAGPGDTLFETARFSNEDSRSSSGHPQPESYPTATSHLQLPQQNPPLASPALLIPTTLSPAPFATTPGRAPRKTKHGIPNRAIDDYFEEGEKRSKEEDYVPPSASRHAPLPPPPGSGPKLAVKILEPQHSRELGIRTNLPMPPPSAGEPRQTRSPDPILDDSEAEEDVEEE